jgi:hypothetical protein
MAAVQSHEVRSFIYYDVVNSGANPVAPFQIVSLATAAELSGLGIRDAIAGRVVVVTPVGTVLGQTVANRRIIGVTKNAAFSGDEVLVQTQGVAEVMANAAIALDAQVHAVARATCASNAAPISNVPEMQLPFDPRATLTYQLCLADDPSLTFSSGGSNVMYYPLGYALAAATAQYDVIPVQLMPWPLTG